MNPLAGTAHQAVEALSADERFALREVNPDECADAIREATSGGADRILISGGDGTLGTAAGVLAGTEVALAVLPGGTLNHFAKSLEIPGEIQPALDVAAGGTVRAVDVGYVNDRLFLNTSSVGAYVAFVRMRDRLERYLGYWLASVVAGLRIMLNLPRYRVALEVDGIVSEYLTPLVFIGVGERALAGAELGERVEDGREGIHVVVIRSRRAARLFALALAAVGRDERGLARLPDVDSFVVDRCTVALAGRRVWLATDGEVLRLASPLEYRFARGALRVVVPPEAAEPPTPAPAVGTDAAGGS